MNDKKLNDLLKQYWRLGAELRELTPQHTPSTRAFPYAQLERAIYWLMDRGEDALDRAVDRLLARLERYRPKRRSRQLGRH